MENNKEIQTEINYQIVQELGCLSENGTWKKEFNIVQWGDNIAKYDIRPWNGTHSRSGKGITLSISELKELKRILNTMDEI